MVDMAEFVVPKSDQLNADDLIAGPRTVRITKVSGTGNGDQPVAVYFDGDSGKPYKPCKSMRRVMIAAWGADASQYGGRSMTIYRDPEVAFGGMKVGGIRISHMSHLEREMLMALTVTKAKRAPYRVLPLASASAKAPGLPIVAPDGTLKQVPAKSWLAAIGRALGMLEDAEAVRSWRKEMGPHLGAMAEADPSMAHEAETLIADRLAELGAREPGEEG